MRELRLRKIVMDRDLRMTGVFRAQSDSPEAPIGFEVNNPWKVCHGAGARDEEAYTLTAAADGGPSFVRRYSLLGLGSAESCTCFSSPSAQE